MITEQTTAVLTALLQGKIPAKVETKALADQRDIALGETLNRFIGLMQDNMRIIENLSQGRLLDIKIEHTNYLASPFKELHSRLLHLTWQARQVASGDYQQRVDFMGDFSEAFNTMIVALECNENALRRKIEELEQALYHITQLERILPICSFCKKIRAKDQDPNNQKSWIPIESYITEKTEAMFSHGLCPECRQQHYGED